MGKVEEVERLVAELKLLDQVYLDARKAIHDNAQARTKLMAELCQYITQRDAASLLGIKESNVSRIVNGLQK